MKKLVATFVAVAFGALLLAAPTTAFSEPGNTCNPSAGHGTSGCHTVTPAPVALGTPTTTSKPVGRSSIRVRRTLTLTGNVSAMDSTGTVTIVKTRKVGRKWKNAGSTTVGLVNGAYRYSFKPTKKGSWRFVAKYSGTWDGTAGFAASKSDIKSVRVVK